ncbi:MAG: hypothetical protein Q9168_008308 [Polycauliona sp. 1 TL-2023]
MDRPLTHCYLLDLPNELLLKIIEHEVHHQDLENLTLCCKTIFALGRQARTKHLDLKKKYSLVEAGNISVEPSNISAGGLHRPLGVHAIFVLLRALDDKTMADYCRTLRLGNDDFQSDETVDDVPAVELCRRIKSILRGSGRSEHIDVFDWEAVEVYRDHDSACSLLLSLLPGTEVLELINGANPIDGFTPSRCYNYCFLQEVRILGAPNDCGDFATLCALASIPSVRKVYGINTVGYNHNSERSDQDYDSAGCSTVRDVHLERSAIQSQSLGYFLCTIKSLQSFHYERSTELSNPYPHDPRHLIDALLKYASQSLQSLTLIDTDALSDDRFGSFGCLSDFRVLKHVALDFYTFTRRLPKVRHHGALEFPGEAKGAKNGEAKGAKKYPFSESSMLSSVPSNRNTYFPSISDWTVDGIPQGLEGLLGGTHQSISRLVDVLPATLESLVLHRPRDIEHLENAFKDLAQLKEERLPNLCKVMIKGKDLPIGGIKDECHKVGISLEFQPATRFLHGLALALSILRKTFAVTIRGHRVQAMVSPRTTDPPELNGIPRQLTRRQPYNSDSYTSSSDTGVGLSLGAIQGIAIGISVGACVVFILLAICIVKRRRAKRMKRATQPTLPPAYSSSAPPYQQAPTHGNATYQPIPLQDQSHHSGYFGPEAIGTNNRTSVIHQPTLSPPASQAPQQYHSGMPHGDIMQRPTSTHQGMVSPMTTSSSPPPNPMQQYGQQYAQLQQSHSYQGQAHDGYAPPRADLHEAPLNQAYSGPYEMPNQQRH